MAIKSLQNPFEIKPPEELSSDLICELFVKEYTEHNALIGNYHTFIIGSRGSGKSMHFKYLEPECQKIENGGLSEFLNTEMPFIGIYINCNKGDFKKQEFIDLLSDGDLQQILVKKMLMHYFVMDTAECVIKTFIEQLSDLLDAEKERKVFDIISKFLAINDTDDKTLNRLKRIFHFEKNKIDDAMDAYFTNYGELDNKLRPQNKVFVDTSLKDDSFLFVLLTSLRREIIEKDSIPFYLLYDEANELLPFQKKIINTLISQRKFAIASIKVSCQPRLYDVYVDINKRPIQETHDYYLIELDSLYTNDKSSYIYRLKEVAEKRLRISKCITTNIYDFLPENPSEKEKIVQAYKYTDEEFESLSDNKRLSSKSEYIKKYGMARFFQLFLKKTSYGYTGFDNLVHFSSGIIRSFLEPCYTMIEEFVKRNSNVKPNEIKQIPYDIQKEVIENYSNLFIQKDIVEPLRIEPAGAETRKILEGLLNLIDSLGAIYSHRLKNKDSREPRIISFSIKEMQRDSLLQKILDHGVQKAFFHQKWYRAKSGHEMLECFILNRRLCPRYHLDLSSFQGRFELSQDDLLIAINDPKNFIKKYEKEYVETEQIQMFDF
jgi:hypothetical protein